MPIAYCTLELYLPYSQSLKEKRMVLRKAQDRLRARSNFSIAEVEYQDLWQRAKLAAVTVGADTSVLERVTQQFVKEAEDILAELLIAPGQTLSVEALRRRYSVRRMITSRLEQLTAAGFIEIGADQKIRLTQRGRWFGRFVTGGRALFGIASAN